MTAPLIAVVNDEPVFVELLEELLTDEGYRVISSTEHHEAYQLIRSQRPNLVILDNRLERPDSGWRLLELMRIDPEVSRIPAIFCSADKRFLDQKQEQLHSYHTEVLEKPFELDELLSKIRTVLGPIDKQARP